MSKSNDLTGSVFGRLTVIEKCERKGAHNETIWRCRCNCGNTVEVFANNLTRGHTKSCGCLRKENTSKMFSKTTCFDVSGDYGIGYTSNTHRPFLFDLSDYDLINNFTWFERKDHYIATNTKNREAILLHMLIMGETEKDCIDHINRDRSDNRRCNLRFATKQENAINRLASKNSKTGIKGVHLNAQNKYVPRIRDMNTTYYLGSFDTLHEAAGARHKKERELFGEFACNDEIT